MLGLIVVIVFGLIIAGLLIGTVALTSKQRTDARAGRIAQVDALIAKARGWRENPQSTNLNVPLVEPKPVIVPAV